jgi:dTDP-4-dehydrorhamnose reductase
MELWGGVECTIARVGDDFRDQTRETGHFDRPDDIERIAALGLRTLRYPVLWEQVSPHRPDAFDFSWHDARLGLLRQNGIGVVAGLCHHGSGPAYAHLLAPEWPRMLAEHAARVAQRYPEISHYTPVNEPLTTARFTGLYGHWYPHGTDYRSFLRALVNECLATVLSMRAIRMVRPDAVLVQTEDLGKTFSTATLGYQAEHENERRWLSFDLLHGRVDRDHPWWGWLTGHGIPEADLELLLEGEGTPGIIGINHYLNSERFLDERVALYPPHLRGGNGRHDYADVEAVRAPVPLAELGPAARLREAWQRYGRPMVVSEAHHGCTREEQLRWLSGVWKAAREVREEGADIRAVTVWALFGARDWSCLLTRCDGTYEPGPFDVRSPVPRPTALARASAALATQGRFDHPVLDRPGWWQRDDRHYAGLAPSVWTERPARSARRLLVTGATGTLGRAVSRIADFRGLEHVLTSRKELDIADPASVGRALDRYRPWAVINAAGFVRVAEAGRERDDCMRDNTEGPRILAEACALRGLPFLTFSSDLVFDGRAGPYHEGDALAPRCTYGKSKAQAERRVLAAHPGALVLRSSAFFGPWDRFNFAGVVLDALTRGRSFEASEDIVSPTYVPDLVHEALNLLIDGETGIWHLVNQGAVSWAEFARVVARLAGLDERLVLSRPRDDIRNTALTSARGLIMPPLDNALRRYLHDVEVGRDESVAAE